MSSEQTNPDAALASNALPARAPLAEDPHQPSAVVPGRIPFRPLSGKITPDLPGGAERPTFALSTLSVMLLVAFIGLTIAANREVFTHFSLSGVLGVLFPMVFGLGITLILSYGAFYLFRRSRFSGNLVFGLIMTVGVIGAGLQAFAKQMMGGVLQDAMASSDLPPELKAQFGAPSEPTARSSSGTMISVRPKPTTSTTTKPTPTSIPATATQPTLPVPSNFSEALRSLAIIPSPKDFESAVRNTRAAADSFSGDQAAIFRSIASTQEAAGFLIRNRDDNVNLFIKAGGVRPETLLASDHQAARSTQIAELIETQTDILAVIRRANDLYTDSLTQEKIDTTQLPTEATRPFPESTLSRLATIEQAQLDLLYGMQSQLEVLRKHAGRWHIESRTNRLKFLDEPATQAYNTAVSETAAALKAFKQAQAAPQP